MILSWSNMGSGKQEAYLVRSGGMDSFSLLDGAVGAVGAIEAAGQVAQWRGRCRTVPNVHQSRGAVAPPDFPSLVHSGFEVVRAATNSPPVLELKYL